MFVTNVLMKKVKSKYVMVLLRSTGSHHKMISFRERSAQKKEIIAFDPLIEMECVFKEERKLKGKSNIKISKQNNESTYGTIPEELKSLVV